MQDGVVFRGCAATGGVGGGLVANLCGHTLLALGVDPSHIMANRRRDHAVSDDDGALRAKRVKIDDDEDEVGVKEEVEAEIPEDADEEEEEEEEAGEEEAPGEPEEGEADDKQKLITRFVFDGVEYQYKQRPLVLEEKEGKIEFWVVNNDNKPESMMVLTGLKNIFQKQLPNMPKEYIARLVYDRSHLSIAVVRKPLTVVGGITYKPFDLHEFAEIVFCAILSTEQVQGYGAHLMNHLKDYVSNTLPIRHFLTYADNYAIGYFKKQGFTKEISLPKPQWMGYIKDYEGGTLMQCTMLPRIRYLDAGKILLLQKAAIQRKVRLTSKLHIVRPGLDHFRDKNFKPLDPMEIPGLKEAGWSVEMDKLAQRPKKNPHHAFMTNLLVEVQNHPLAWPFKLPVNGDDVVDYYEVIKEPMDLSAMENKLENDKYPLLAEFIYDMRLVFNNCRVYNPESTPYYKHATKLEKFFNGKVKASEEYLHYLD